MEEFTGEVLGDKKSSKVLMPSKHNTEDERDYSLSDEFAINDCKKNARICKSVIKLDKTSIFMFTVNHRKLIQQGQDENGNFYMLYFEERTKKKISKH